MLPRYLAVTPEAIREVAAAVFRPDNRRRPDLPAGGSPADDVTLTEAESSVERRGGGGMSTTPEIGRDGPVVAERPQPGAPRPYEFPAVSSDSARQRPDDPGRRPAGPAARLGVARS